MNVYFREIKAHKKSIIIWSVAMILLIVMSIQKYDAFMGNETGAVEFSKLIESIPKVMQAMIGLSTFDITTPIGYLGVLYIYLILMGSIHAGMIGVGIISKEERDKTVEFLMTKPIERSRIVTSKILAALTNVVIFNFVTYISIILIMNKELSMTFVGEVGLLMLGMLFIQMLFMIIGVGVALVSSSHKKAGSVTMSIILISYFLSLIIDISDKLNVLKIITPFKYFDAKEILDSGISVWYALLTGVIISLVLKIGYDRYNKRDVNI